MPINDRSIRLRGLRDRLHLTGERAPTFAQAVTINLEIMSIVKSPRNLALVRRDIQKLRDRLAEPTPEQLEKLTLLDQRLTTKCEQARVRKVKKHCGKQRALKQPLEPILVPTSVDAGLDQKAVAKTHKPWPVPGDRDFRGIFDEFLAEGLMTRAEYAAIEGKDENNR